MASYTIAAVIQMTSTGDVERNLSTVERLVGEAAARGASLAVLPEGFAYLGPEEGKAAVAESLPEGGRILSCCRGLARRTGCELVFAGFPEKSGNPKKVFNACVHMNASGDVAAVYRKMHLFEVSLEDGTAANESATTEPGRDVVVTDTSFGRLGLSICYDLRFPELYRRLVDGGAIALAVPSAFTQTTGRAHWHVLLRARAIESQCYVLAAAQVGRHYGDKVSFGHAMIVDPWGVILDEVSDDGEGVAVASIDPTLVATVRRQLPSLRHRKLT